MRDQARCLIGHLKALGKLWEMVQNNSELPQPGSEEAGAGTHQLPRDSPVESS